VESRVSLDVKQIASAHTLRDKEIETPMLKKPHVECPNCNNEMKLKKKLLPEEAGKQHFDCLCTTQRCPQHNRPPIRIDFLSGCNGFGPCPIHAVDPGERCPSSYVQCTNPAH
jgi:hypothetical protein